VHWFIGEGMIHGVRLEGGRAVWYRNRWVRTCSFTDGATLVREDGTRDLTASLANTHVVNHAGRTLVLVESSLPYEITHELNTRALRLSREAEHRDFHGKLSTAMTAHPKICPETGELHFFGYSSREPYVTYHRADAHGELRITRPIGVPGPTMMHDFTLTRQHVVFLDLPVVLDGTMSGMPFRWDEGYDARIGVLCRSDPVGEVHRFSIDPCYGFHTLNAHEAGDRIVLHVVRYPHLWWPGHEDAPATLWRWTVDLATGQVTEEQLHDRPCEFPRIDDRLAGLDVRYGHVTARDALVRYNLHGGGSSAHTFGPGRTPAEAVFAPPNWLITYVYDRSLDTSELVILDTIDLRPPGRERPAASRKASTGIGSPTSLENTPSRLDRGTFVCLT
jgi:carotenoid cleavage dioxygenase-like enzyme